MLALVVWSPDARHHSSLFVVCAGCRIQLQARGLSKGMGRFSAQAQITSRGTTKLALVVFLVDECTSSCTYVAPSSNSAPSFSLVVFNPRFLQRRCLANFADIHAWSQERKPPGT